MSRAMEGELGRLDWQIQQGLPDIGVKPGVKCPELRLKTDPKMLFTREELDDTCDWITWLAEHSPGKEDIRGLEESWCHMQPQVQARLPDNSALKKVPTDTFLAGMLLPGLLECACSELRTYVEVATAIFWEKEAQLKNLASPDVLP